MPWVRYRHAAKDIALSEKDMPASHRLQSPCHAPGGFRIKRRRISTRPKPGDSTEPEIRRLRAIIPNVAGRIFNCRTGHAPSV